MDSLERAQIDEGWSDFWLQHCLQGGLLRAWREVLGWTQEQMVVKIQQYTQSDKPDLKTYQRWEQGKSLPHPRNFLTLRQLIRDLRAYYSFWLEWSFELDDFGIHLWMFLDPKSGERVRWVLVHSRT